MNIKFEYDDNILDTINKINKALHEHKLQVVFIDEERDDGIIEGNIEKREDIVFV